MVFIASLRDKTVVKSGFQGYIQGIFLASLNFLYSSGCRDFLFSSTTDKTYKNLTGN